MIVGLFIYLTIFIYVEFGNDLLNLITFENSCNDARGSQNRSGTNIKEHLISDNENPLAETVEQIPMDSHEDEEVIAERLRVANIVADKGSWPLDVKKHAIIVHDLKKVSEYI